MVKINMIRLPFTYTGSLMYETKTEIVYEDLTEHKEMFDFSNYSATIIQLFKILWWFKRISCW